MRKIKDHAEERIENAKGDGLIHVKKTYERCTI